MSLPILKQYKDGPAIGRATPAQGVWDTEVAAAGTAISQISFFARTKGGPDNSGQITNKNYGDTNLQQPRQLPNAVRMEVHSLCVTFYNFSAGTPYGLTRGDVDTLLNRSWYELKISDIVVCREVMRKVPFGTFMEMDGNTTADIGLVFRTGVAHRSNNLNCKLGKANPTIGPTELFYAEINWPANITPAEATAFFNELYGVLVLPM